jgi:hypothetical protein
LCISRNSGDSRAHSIEIGIIVPQLAQAGVGVGHSAADRLTELRLEVWDTAQSSVWIR